MFLAYNYEKQGQLVVWTIRTTRKNKNQLTLHRVDPCVSVAFCDDDSNNEDDMNGCKILGTSTSSEKI